jgi:cobalt-precorrin 5A hydrolase/precorrin-3B C17-methyltransferase
MGRAGVGRASPRDPSPERIVSVAVTAAGAELASRLPFPRLPGPAGEAIRNAWDEVDGLVCFLAVGAAVRIVAPLVRPARGEPAVVCVDAAGRFAVPLLNGHGALGANALARRVAALLDGTAVVTSASDAAGRPALDTLADLPARGAVAQVSRALLDGDGILLENPLDWPLPAALLGALPDGTAASPSPEDRGPVAPGPSPLRIVVTDRAEEPPPGTVVLHPPSLVAGIGTASDATEAEVAAALAEALRRRALAPESVGVVATIERRRDHPAVLGLGLPVRSFPAEDLATVVVPNPSDTVAAAVGTPSVAEAAALLEAGPGASLLLAKQVFSRTTIALARRSRPRGHLAVVGVGPGGPAHRTPAAEAAIRRAEILTGYGPYLDLVADLVEPRHQLVPSPIGRESERAAAALALARAGRRVALVCSGDAGIYGMASLVLESAGSTASHPSRPRPPVEGETNGGQSEAAVEIEIVPGVTAALAAAALLGAPLGHDHALVSLSDLLTPWQTIEARLEGAGAADLVVALYNPRSSGRTWQLPRALGILGRYRPASTPVGVVTDAGRDGQRAYLTTIEDLDVSRVGMTTTVVVGSSQTRVVGTWMVTPRGYAHRPHGSVRDRHAVGDPQAGPVDVGDPGDQLTHDGPADRVLSRPPTAHDEPLRTDEPPLRIDARCTACGACVVTCPEHALAPARHRPTLDPARCSECWACVEVCPTGAITPRGHEPIGQRP